MGDLFSTFNPETRGAWGLRGNWIAGLAGVIILPQSYWLIRGQLLKLTELTFKALNRELRAVLGALISPGRALIFVACFRFILRVNFLGLTPYVFTPSSHLRFTLRLALPLWLGKIIYSFIKQLEHNIAHLVPEGTPGALIPLIVLIESVSLVIRPGTLAVRLAANIIAGHLLLVLLGGQGVNLRGAVLRFLMVGLCLLVTLECAVACIQAYVFTILRSLYLREHSSKILSVSGV